MSKESKNSPEGIRLILEGRPVKEIVVAGNGKNTKLTLVGKGEDLPYYQIPACDPRIEIEIDGKVRTEIFSEGDPYLGIRYLPAEELVYAQCRIENIPFKRKEDFEKSLQEVGRRGQIEVGWMITRAWIRLVPAASYEETSPAAMDGEGES